jgi:hypothetical protein
MQRAYSPHHRKYRELNLANSVQTFEQDSSRKREFPNELEEIRDALDRLELRKIIPDDFADTAVQTKAVLVLEAFINLIGQQLTYLKTFGAKAGFPSTTKRY